MGLSSDNAYETFTPRPSTVLRADFHDFGAMRCSLDAAAKVQNCPRLAASGEIGGSESVRLVSSFVQMKRNEWKRATTLCTLFVLLDFGRLHRLAMVEC